MDLHLGNAKALITGGSQGLGLAIAHRLAEEGASVAVLGRDEQRLDTAKHELERHGGRVVAVSADVTDPGALHAAVDQAAVELGGLERVVANVGGTVGERLADSAPEQVYADITATLALNAGHAAALVSAAEPHMRAAGGGSAVFIASITGMRPAPRTAYAAAKAAEIHLAATLAQELASASIRVNAVSPGSILFPGGGWEHYREQNPEQFEQWLVDEFPWGRLGTADEVADVVTFLLSDRSSWITGANIPVDGGQGRPSARRFPHAPLR